jgi:hypothetical protein
MGIVLGALGGMGSAMQDMGMNQQKAWLEQDNQANASALALQREQALEVFKNNLQVTTANQQRDAQTSRINNAASGIVTGQLADKYASSDAAVQAAQGGASPDVSAAEGNDNVQAALTPEQQAVIDQSKASDKASMMADPNTRTKAAIQTGDISPKDAMLDESRNEINRVKTEAAIHNQETKTAAYLEVQSARNDVMNARNELQFTAAMAKLEAKLAAAGNGGTDFDKKIALLKESGASPSDIANFITERKQPSLEDLANGFLKSDPNAGTKKALTPEAAYEKATQLRNLTKMLDKNAPAPSSAPAGTASSPKATSSNSADSDQTLIYQNEYKKAQDKVQNPTKYLTPDDLKSDPDGSQFAARAQSDVDGIKREAQRAGVQLGDGPLKAPGIVAAAKPASAASGTKDYSKLWK